MELKWQDNNSDKRFKGNARMMENRRRYPRYPVDFVARIYTADLSLPVQLVDISRGGIGIISEKSIETAGKVSISLFPIREDPIVGNPVWSCYFEKEQKYYYRIGFETEQLDLEKMEAYGFPIRSELESEIVPQIKKTDSKNRKA